MYLLCIPVFAVIYSFLSDDFYQATIEREGILQQHEKQIADWFVRVIESKAVLDQSKLRGSGCNERQLKSARMLVHATPYILTSADSKRIKNIYADLTTKAECGDYQVQLLLGDVNADIFHGKQRVLSFLPFRPTVYFPEKYTKTGKLVFDQIQTTSEYCDDIRHIYPDLKYSKGACQLWADQGPSKELRFLQDQYDKALQGKITDIGKFGRMMYFSVTTITTLGYGDIVPLTAQTRFFVALESVLGIILIGLFLSSLVSSRKT